MLLATSCLFLFFSCAEDQITKDPIGEFSALKNGEPWVDNYFGTMDLIEGAGDPENSFKIIYVPNCNDTTIVLQMRRINISDFKYLAFMTGEFTKGKYGLIDDKERCQIENLVQVSYGTLEGGDAGGKSYDLLPSDDNYFSINSIDRIQNLVTGEFQVSLLNKNNDADTVRFTEGKFSIQNFR